MVAARKKVYSAQYVAFLCLAFNYSEHYFKAL